MRMLPRSTPIRPTCGCSFVARPARHRTDQTDRGGFGFRHQLADRDRRDSDLSDQRQAGGTGAVTTAAKFWRAANPIYLYRLRVRLLVAEQTERIPGSGYRSSRPGSLICSRYNRSRWRSPTKCLLTSSANASAPAIRCQLTPRGLLMQSDDTLSLGSIRGVICGRLPARSILCRLRPSCSFLKYTRAADAIRMLAELLDGGEAAEVCRRRVAGQRLRVLVRFLPGKPGDVHATAPSR